MGFPHKIQAISTTKKRVGFSRAMVCEGLPLEYQTMTKQPHPHAAEWTSWLHPEQDLISWVSYSRICTLRQSSDLIWWYDSSHGTLYMLNWNKLLSLNKLLIINWTDCRVGLTLWYMYSNSCQTPAESLPLLHPVCYSGRQFTLSH